ncbi:MAG: hypothetical protein KF724_08760 [Phycisphaeraceae bacterium]|nr:hypothetical protein [Phycisphaeraceae bacterium]
MTTLHSSTNAGDVPHLSTAELPQPRVQSLQRRWRRGLEATLRNPCGARRPRHTTDGDQLRSVLAILMLSLTAIASSARADEVLAERLIDGLRASKLLTPTAKQILEPYIRRSATPLPSLPVQVLVRIDRDLANAIDGREWPFYFTGSTLTMERLQWMGQGLEIAIERLEFLSYPTTEECNQMASWATIAGNAAARFTRESLADESSELRDDITRALRLHFQEQAWRFCNPFVPSLLKPCETSSTEELEQRLIKVLQDSELIESSRSAHRAFEEAANANAEQTFGEELRRQVRMSNEFMIQTKALTEALVDFNAPCLASIRGRLSPPAWHTELGSIISQRELELQAQAASRGSGAAVVGAQASGSSPSSSGSRGTQGDRLSIDDALAQAFAGSGVRVEFSTALLPNSWIRSERLWRDWSGEKSTE